MSDGRVLGKIVVRFWTKKLMNIHLETNLVHNLKLRKSPLVRYQMENLRVKSSWETNLMHNLELRKSPLVRYQMENLRVKSWETLVPSYAPLLIFQVEM